MKISVEITGQQEQALAEAARHLNVPPDELAVAARRAILLRSLTPGPRVPRRACWRRMEKNRELYRRLA